MENRKTKIIYYFALLAVVVLWGFDPIIIDGFLEYYSASALSIVFTFSSLIFFLTISRTRLRELDRSFILRAVPICLINSVAMVIQRIGLQYTTPSNYAFLEHLSCAAVPFAIFAFTGTCPSLKQILAVVICISGCFIFTGGFDSNLGIGEFLCAMAGILVGISTVATGIYAKKLDTLLFNNVYLLVYFLTSLITAVLLNLIKINGEPLENIRFSLSAIHLIPALLFGIVSIGLCWLLRTAAIKHVGSVTVAVVSPVSAVITGVISLTMGKDNLSFGFIIGAFLILVSATVSSFLENSTEIKSKKQDFRA